jgi:hypothetical protein
MKHRHLGDGVGNLPAAVADILDRGGRYAVMLLDEFKIE